MFFKKLIFNNFYVLFIGSDLTYFLQLIINRFYLQKGSMNKGKRQGVFFV